MAGKEKDDYQTLKKNVFKGLDRIDRIENIVVAGMFDINYCIDGIEGWIELKSPKEPKRLSTPLFGSNHKLSIDQMNWALRQRNAGGIAFVLIATDLRWMLIDGKFSDQINTSTVDVLENVARWSAVKPIDSDHWNGLRLAITSIDLLI